MKIFLAILAAVAAAGCNRVSTFTTINANGGFQEKISFKLGQVPSLYIKAEPTVEKEFNFDRAGTTVVHSEEKTAQVLTVQRNRSAGTAPYQDFQLLSDKGKVILTSKVSVHRALSGDISYDVKIKWMGSSEPGLAMIDADWRAAITKALPPRYRINKPVIDRVSRGIGLSLTRFLMGPPYPEAPGLIGNPDAVKLRFDGTFHQMIQSELDSDAPGLSPSERSLVVKTFMHLIDAGKYESDQESKQDKAGESRGLTPLLYEVAFPGKIVETNGLTNPVTGHVYWSLYAASASLGDIHLHLVVRP